MLISKAVLVQLLMVMECIAAVGPPITIVLILPTKWRECIGKTCNSCFLFSFGHVKLYVTRKSKIQTHHMQVGEHLKSDQDGDITFVFH
ncbi:uncharacterized protein BYT42DRAFT_573248 [Radiomyces spectabilis]|uniref:uncharacterized protein n=1 Tax=Radiomyces spectabilis TaxID=64574 RepID=UPI00221E9BBA|nr:uncharacterized protein BYT42DRAFT_573248 [Radiomyces spectabilis]KAI8376046.1 hypothetical protein BYT42DRAFT_573248 [Radiomyces spectabilis]